MNRPLFDTLRTTPWAARRAAFRWSIPPGFSIPETCCDNWAAREPDRLALSDLSSGQDWSYGQLKSASDALAQSFLARGLRAGDRVGVFLPQSAAVIVTHFAAQKCAAIALPLFTQFGPEALAFRLADSGATMVVTDAENLEKLLSVAPDLPALRQVYVTGPVAPPHLNLLDEISKSHRAFTPAPVNAETPAVMIYTSGTTGPPKGALHAHRFLLGHLPCMEFTHEGFPRPGDIGWTPADWAWIGGLMDMAIPCLYYGVPLIASRAHRFDPAEAWALMRDRRVTSAFLPPTALKLMRAAPVPQGVRLRSVSSGGESLGADLLEWGHAALGCPINEMYGQTECNLVVTQAAGFMTVKPGTMGQALPGHEVAVIDDLGRECAPGEVGEIAVRRGSASMFLGYWNQPEKTAAKFTGDWMRTGDLGTRDAEGYFTYVARDDDVITSSGYRIGPTEIENCLMGDADVIMAAVVGLPDPIRTEAVTAFVVLRETTPLTPEIEARLIARVKSRLSPHLAPRRIIARDALPLTATGKVMRRALRDGA
jgi:acetyl-CoA synthetase